jgi:DUF4097 and DUF4098 domain-containing protein YvlB
MVVDNRVGNVTVEGAGVAEVSVQATLKAYGGTENDAQLLLDEMDVVLEETDGVLKVSGVYPSSFRGSVSYKIQLPHNIPVRLRTSNGAITATGIANAVTAKTSNGKVKVLDSDGPIEVSTSNGAIEIETSRPTTVLAETSNGSIRFDGALVGDANRFESTNGSLKVNLWGDAVNVDIKTSNGTVRANGEKLQREATVAVGQPSDAVSDVGGRLRLRTSNGSITVDHSGPRELNEEI